MKKSTAALLTGILLSVFVWVNFYWWLTIWSNQRRFEENLGLFLNKFPVVMRDGTLIGIIHLLFCGISIRLFLAAQKNRKLKPSPLSLL